MSTLTPDQLREQKVYTSFGSSDNKSLLKRIEDKNKKEIQEWEDDAKAGKVMRII